MRRAREFRPIVASVCHACSSVCIIAPADDIIRALLNVRQPIRVVECIDGLGLACDGHRGQVTRLVIGIVDLTLWRDLRFSRSSTS